MTLVKTLAYSSIVLAMFLVQGVLAAAEKVSEPSILPPQERVFDIIPGEGQSVEQVDGFTVIRLPSKTWGMVVTYSPESSTRGWLPLAVINLGEEVLKVDRDAISVQSAGQPLHVYGNNELITEAGRELQPGMAAQYEQVRAAREGHRDRSVVDDLRSQNGNANRVAQMRARQARAPLASKDNVPTGRRLRNILEMQQELLAERLFKDARLAPREVARGDVAITLPEPTEAGPAEFVFSLTLANETLTVKYRERAAP